MNEVAPDFLEQREQELVLDADPRDVERLRDRFNDIITFCVKENRRNVFLVEATKLRETEWGRDIAALKELRFIHNVANLTVKSGSPRYTGRRYEAFVLDIRAYAGNRVRKIEMIDFWTSEGKQKIRGARFIYRPDEGGARAPHDAESTAEAEQLTFELVEWRSVCRSSPWHGV